MAKLCQIVTAGETSIMFFVLFLHVNSLQQILKNNNSTQRQYWGEGKGFYYFF